MFFLRSIASAMLALTLLGDPGAAATGDVKGHLDCQKFPGYCLLEHVALVGVIDDTMVTGLSQLLKDAESRIDKAKQPQGIAHTQVTLDSPGGSVVAAMAIGRLLRKYRMQAVVPPDAVCSSACVLVYAGAVIRYGHFKSGRVGIHQPFLDAPKAAEIETLRGIYTSVLQDMKSYLREMNVSEQLADEMLKTPSSMVRYLDDEEQNRFGLVIFDPIEVEITNLQHSRELGISRVEYNRREALVLEHCPPHHNYRDCYEKIFSTGRIEAREPLDFSSQAVSPSPRSGRR